MALISTSNYTGGTVTGQYVTKALTGAVNVQASHTFMIRVKHGLTTTNYDSIAIDYFKSSVTFNVGGSFLGRVNGASSTSISMLRESDAFTPAIDQALAASCYGNTSTWYHLTFAYDAPNALIRTYVDGVASGTISSPTNRVASSTSNGIAVGLHNGKMADAAWFNRLLTPSEILSMASYRVPQVTSGLFAFWRLDANATDSSGNGNNGTTTGSAPNVSYSTADNPPQPETPAINIDGEADSATTLSATITVAKPAAATLTSASTLSSTVTVSKPAASTLTSGSTLTGNLRTAKPLAVTATSATSLSAALRPRWGRRFEDSGNTEISASISVPGSAPYTIMFWRKSVVAPTAGFPGLTLNASGGRFISLAAGPSGINLLLNDGATDIINYTTTDDLGWHHYAITFDGTTARAYLDGSLVGSGNPASTSTYTSLAIDGTSTDIIEAAIVKVWTAQLTATEIGNERTYYTPYNKLASLYGWWQLSWQNSTLDSSGNGNTLTDLGTTEARSESPGQAMTLVASTATSASTLSGALVQAQPLASTATSASTLSAAATITKPAAGTLTSASTLTGNLGTFKPIAAAATSASTLTGALGQTQPLASTATSASTLTGTTTALVAGTATSASTLSAALVQAQVLASTATTASALTGAIGINGIFAGAATSASTLIGSLSTTKPIAAIATSASTLAGSLAQTQPLAATATSASSLTGDVKALVLLSGSASTASTLSAQLGVTYTVAGTATSASTLAGVLNVGVPLASIATSASTFTGALISLKALAGTATTASTLTATISNVALVTIPPGTATSASTLFGALGVLVPASAIGQTYSGARVNQVFYEGPPAGPIIPSRPWPPRPR